MLFKMSQQARLSQLYQKMSRLGKTGAGSAARTRVRVSDQLLHQRDQVFLVEWPGAVGARIEEAPYLLLLFQGIEEKLLFDEAPIQQFLVERANDTLEGVWKAQVLGGDQPRRGLKLNLKNSSLDVDLEQVFRLFLKSVWGELRRIEHYLGAGEQTVERAHKTRADRVQAGGRVSAELSYFAGVPQKVLVLLRQRIDALRQPLEPSIPDLIPTGQPAQSRRLPSSIPAFCSPACHRRLHP